MGIPKFFRWISERYPMCSQLIADNRIPEFDNLYLDMNGIVHNCSHNNNDSAHFRITEEQIWIGIFNYIDHLFSKIKPKKFFFLAIDGVAPRAKMNQQRSRRFRTASEAEENKQKALERGEDLPSEDAFDSNCITPGTDFMKKLTLELRYFIAKKVSEDANWRGVEIVLSGPEVPGEGEHKIMDYIRLAKAQPDYDPNTRHCLYGLDADLVMLGLLSHDPHFALLREEVTFGKQNQKKKQSLDSQNFYLMHLSLMREYLELEFQSLSTLLSFPYDFERILDDFILLALFVGNDFLPHLPNLHINEGALGLMFRIYKDVLPTCKGYIQDGGHVDMTSLEKILNEISSIVEKEAFEMENIDTLYLGGKQDNGQNQRQLLHQLEKKKKKKKSGKMAISEKQFNIFEQVKAHLVSETSEREPIIIDFEEDVKAQDCKFVEKLAQDLNMHCTIDQSRISISFGDNSDSTDDSDLANESEVDVEAIAARDRVFKKYSEAEIETESIPKEDIEREEKERFEADLKQWKADYYMEKMDIDIDNQEQMDELVSSYVVGIQWVLRYYYEGVASWGWFYPFHYAPKISDMKNIARFQDYNFTLGQPFKPFEQLMGVLPSLSRKLLPEAYRDLMINIESPIIDFYPRQFDTDMNGKKQDWEAIVKIPFIDEKRLLSAMQNREQRLSKEQRDMSREGDSYQFVYDEELAKMDRADLPVYPSPLPNVFPDIHQCLVRETIYHLPSLKDKTLRKGLLPGAKIGKDALAGFPSLATIDYNYEIKHHGVKVFQQESRNESVVITLKNKYEGATIKEIAELFLYSSIYVHYPYLQEAIVIGVSNAEKKYYMNADFRGNNKAKHINEHLWEANEIDNWKNSIEHAEYISSKRFALMAGVANAGDNTEIGFHVCVLNGMRLTEEGALFKEYVNPSLEALVPIQTVVIKVNNPDPRFIEKPAPTISDKFPLKSPVFLFGNKLFGTQAEVVGYSKDGIDIELTVPAEDQHHIEPGFGHEIARKQDMETVYKPIDNAARELGLYTRILSKIASDLTIKDKSGARVHIGLGLTFQKKGEKVPGYTRKSPAGQWEFSDTAISLIREYIEAFPGFIDLLKNQKSNQKDRGDMISIEDFAWTNDKPAALKQMKEWINLKKIKNFICVPFTDEQLEEKYVKDIEKNADGYNQIYEKLEMKKLLIRGVPRTRLITPADAEARLKYQEFNLGDRIVYVSDTGSIQLGSKGTVVGVQEKAIDVVFDDTFMNGTTLDGFCSEYRGANLPYFNVLNLSNCSALTFNSSSARNDSNQNNRNSENNNGGNYGDNKNNNSQGNKHNNYNGNNNRRDDSDFSNNSDYDSSRGGQRGGHRGGHRSGFRGGPRGGPRGSRGGQRGGNRDHPGQDAQF